MSNSSGVSSMNLVWQRPATKIGMGQNVGDKGDVGLDAPHPYLVDGTGCLAAGGGEVMIPAGDLHQQRVVVGGDDGAHVGIAAVQPDAEAAGGGVGRDLAVVGGEVVGGVLGGDTALDGVAVDVDVLLAGSGRSPGGSGDSPAAMRIWAADDIHAGDHLRHRVLHLNAGVHLDEVVAAVLIHQKLHRTGADVAHRAGQSSRRPGAAPPPSPVGRTMPGRTPPPSDTGAGGSSPARPDDRRCRAGPPGSAPRCAWAPPDTSP